MIFVAHNKLKSMEITEKLFSFSFIDLSKYKLIKCWRLNFHYDWNKRNYKCISNVFLSSICFGFSLISSRSWTVRQHGRWIGGRDQHILVVVVAESVATPFSDGSGKPIKTTRNRRKVAWRRTTPTRTPKPGNTMHLRPFLWRAILIRTVASNTVKNTGRIERSIRDDQQHQQQGDNGRQ